MRRAVPAVAVAVSLASFAFSADPPKPTVPNRPPVATPDPPPSGPQPPPPMVSGPQPGAMAPAQVGAAADLAPASGSSVKGRVTFAPTGSALRVKAQITGLSIGTHGFHVHEVGDCSAPDATSAGGHFNPANHPHGGPKDAQRHAGDLGNIEAGPDGTAWLDATFSGLGLDGPTGIVGRSVVVHAAADDLKTAPAGNAGARVACGVVKVAKE